MELQIKYIPEPVVENMCEQCWSKGKTSPSDLSYYEHSFDHNDWTNNPNPWWKSSNVADKVMIGISDSEIQFQQHYRLKFWLSI